MQPRKVVSIFDKNWMVYDRYGHIRFTGDRACLYNALHGKYPAASRAGAAVPNTQLKVKADSKTVDSFPDESAELVLTPDALAYYEECDQKRRQNADDVRAEAGDTDFKLGESLRVNYLDPIAASRQGSASDVRKRQGTPAGLQDSP
jgi:hypothetical protein